MLGQIFDSHAEEHIQRDVKKLVARPYRAIAQLVNAFIIPVSRALTSCQSAISNPHSAILLPSPGLPRLIVRPLTSAF